MMLELHNLRPGTIERRYRGRGYITKFTNYTVSENGQSKNYDFEPEYDLVLYVYSISPKVKDSFREINVQYGYMYQDTSGAIYSFPVFREVPTEDNRKVSVWKVSDDDWKELEVVRISSNFYAYSLPGNRDLKKFLDGAENVIEKHRESLTKKYDKDMAKQDEIEHDLKECLLNYIDD